MDTYSYISENGVIREIADVVARTKNSEQDLSINEVTLKTNRLAGYSESETQIGTWINGKTVYRQVFATVAIGATPGAWTYTGITIVGAETLVSARALRKYDSYSDQLSWFSFRIMPDGRLMYYAQEGSSPLVNVVVLEYTKA